MTDDQLLKILDAVRPKPTVADKLKYGVTLLTFAFSLAYFGLQIIQMDLHKQLDQAALTILGLKRNGEVLEESTKTLYKKQLEYIEHCKTAKTCNLPPHLAVADPMPNYIPTAAILLPKETIEKGEH